MKAYGQSDSASLVTAAAPKTASFNTSAFETQNYDKLFAYLNVSAHGGTTPTLDIKFQDSIDGTNWVDVPSGAFAQVTTTDGIKRLVLTDVGPYCRAVVTIGGTTPTYTMTLDVFGRTINA